MNESNSTSSSSSSSSGESPLSGFGWTDYVYFSISVAGVCTNAINICVFLSPKLKETSYRFMLARSVANLLYLALSFVDEFLVYCNNCPITYTYFAVLYTITAYVFLIGTLSIYRAFIENVILLHTYCILTNKNWTKIIRSIWIVLILAVISLVYNIPKLFSFSIEQVPGVDMFYVDYTKFGASFTNKVLVITQTLFKIFLTSVLLPVNNLVNLILFRRRFNNRIISTTTNTTNINPSVIRKFTHF